MPHPHGERTSRRNRMLRLLAAGPHTVEALAQRLHLSRSQAYRDLQALERRFPGRLQGDSGPGASRSWPGHPPHLLAATIDHLDHLELIALVAARGLLRAPGSDSFDGPLDGALHRLLQRLGVEPAAHALDPAVIEVSRFAAAVEDPAQVVSALTALLENRCLTGAYANLAGAVHDVHLVPLRLLLVDGEFLLLAWDGATGPVKNYRMSRFRHLTTTPVRPRGAPDPIPADLVSRHRRAAFRSHGNPEPKHHHRVSLALSATVRPHVIGRTWGLDQTWDDTPHNLPPGWSRLTFTTSGLPACRHWVLSLGAGCIAEAPEELRTWLAEQAAAISAHYGPKPTAAHTATPDSHADAKPRRHDYDNRGP